MNCDQVFDILTRGPFPTGTACDSGVEAHLEVCSECRRLAEALRPALELFQEAVGPEESRDLPGYWCAVATDRQQPFRQQPLVSYASDPIPPRLAPRIWSPPVSRGISPLTVWRMAAMLALGVTLGLLFSSRVALDGISRIPPFMSGAAAAPGPLDDGRLHLFSESERAELATLPAACWEHRPTTSLRYTVRGDQLLAKADLEKLKCCSGCHNSHSDRVPSSATLTVAQQCHLCHNTAQHSSRAAN